MGAFWNYFAEKLCWPQSFAPGPLQAIVRGLARHLDVAREDMPYLRDQFFPEHCAPELVPDHGTSRSLVRHPRETPGQFRTRVGHAWGWHMLGGKTLGLPQILRFYGFEALNIETLRDAGYPTRWAEFMVGLKTPQNNNYTDILATLETLIWLINEYKPARSVLFRIHTDEFDRRPIVVGNGPKLGDGWLSYFSGVTVPGLPEPGGNVIVSFGVKNSFQSECYLSADMGGSFGATTRLGFLAPYLDTFVVGRSQLSSVQPRNNPFVIGSFFSILWADRAKVPRRWEGEWDERSWLDYTGFDRQLPLWTMRTRAASRSQLVPGWGEVVSDTNARLGATFTTVIDNPFRLGASALSNHNCQRRELRLHEMRIEPLGVAVPPLNPGVPRAAGTSRLSTAPATPNPERGQVCGLHALAVATPPVDSPPAHAGQGQALATRSTPPNLPDPSSAVTTFQAPLWIGAWADPDRAWNTSQKISAQ